jgi:hypothetical protein
MILTTETLISEKEDQCQPCQWATEWITNQLKLRTWRFNQLFLCEVWDCEELINGEEGVCEKHIPLLDAGLLDDCPLCDLLKPTKFQTCGDCNVWSVHSSSRSFNSFRDRYERTEDYG